MEVTSNYTILLDRLSHTLLSALEEFADADYEIASLPYLVVQSQNLAAHRSLIHGKRSRRKSRLLDNGCTVPIRISRRVSML